MPREDDRTRALREEPAFKALGCALREQTDGQQERFFEHFDTGETEEGDQTDAQGEVTKDESPAK